jgi:hypothetical protein
MPTKPDRLITMGSNITYSKDHAHKHLLDALLIQNGLKQGDALFRFISNLILEYSVRKIQESLQKLKSNGSHQLLAYMVNQFGRKNYPLKNKESSYMLMMRLV